MAPATVIVTGAGRGIGAAIARRLAGDGWAVVAADIDGPAAEATARAIGGLAVAADVGIEADVARLVAAARTFGPGLSAIVANAAVNPRGPIASLSLETWNRALAVNLTSAMLLARAGEAELRRTKGAIVTITSTRAHMSEPHTLPYSASKGGLVALTHALALELAPDVRVNCISPGWIDTGRHGAVTTADHAQHPAGRVGVPDDVAGLTAYLLSEEARFITGAEFVVDGGMTRKMIYV